MFQNNLQCSFRNDGTATGGWFTNVSLITDSNVSSDGFDLRCIGFGNSVCGISSVGGGGGALNGTWISVREFSSLLFPRGGTGGPGDSTGFFGGGFCDASSEICSIFCF